MTVRQRHHRGFTLVELLTVMFCTLVLTSIAIALLHHVGSWGASVRGSSTQASAANRMELALRRELQQATDVQPAGATLTITTPAGSSQWQMADDACQTTWTTGDESTRHERYTIGPHAEWQASTTDGLTTVLLEVAAGERGMPLRVVEPGPVSTAEKAEGEDDE